MTPINLQTFASTDETRPELLKPFTLGQWTYSTDGRVLVRVPAAEYPAESAPKAPKNVETLFSWDHDAITDWLSPTAEMLALEYEECPKCGGYGPLVCSECDQTCGCPRCDGDGRIVPGQNSAADAIQLGGVRLNTKYVMLLKSLPGLQFRPRGELEPVLWRADGGAFGYLMPMRSDPHIIRSPGPTKKSPSELAGDAIKHVLRRIQEDEATRNCLGACTESFAKLTEAAAALFEQDVDFLREAILPGTAIMHSSDREATERKLAKHSKK